jgi:hypothetical protein
MGAADDRGGFSGRPHFFLFTFGCFSPQAPPLTPEHVLTVSFLFPGK